MGEECELVACVDVVVKGPTKRRPGLMVISSTADTYNDFLQSKTWVEKKFISTFSMISWAPYRRLLMWVSLCKAPYPPRHR